MSIELFKSQVAILAQRVEEKAVTRSPEAQTTYDIQGTARNAICTFTIHANHGQDTFNITYNNGHVDFLAVYNM